VTNVTADVARLIEHMHRLMLEREGVGLAANQVGAPLRIFVHKLVGAAPDVLINPRVIRASGNHVASEGCLSLKLPGAHALVARPSQIVVEAETPARERVRITARGYLARVFQHEIDHLDGIEYVQRLENGERDRVYAIMRAHRLPVDLMPARPYGQAAFFRPASAMDTRLPKGVRGMR